jgi:hypothetical protein
VARTQSRKADRMGQLVVRGLASLLLLAVSEATQGQGYGGGATTGFGISPSITYSGGASAYLPSGMNGGSFVPYTPGPGGGLGVQVRAMPIFGTSSVPGGMGGTTMMGLASTGLGRPRWALTPLAPIRAVGPGMGAGSMIQRPSTPGGMGGTTRPPVGSYPFRQPPGLIGGSAPGAPAMSM